MTWILDRLREPSTYAGLATLLVAAGLSASAADAIGDAGLAVATGIAAVLGAIAAIKAD